LQAIRGNDRLQAGSYTDHLMTSLFKGEILCGTVWFFSPSAFIPAGDRARPRR
jgi:hypothetical protein